MNILKRIILALCLHVHVIFPSIAFADFKVYSGQEVPLFELGTNLLNSDEGGCSWSRRTNSKTCIMRSSKKLLCIQTEMKGSNSSSELKVAGLQVDFQSLYGDSLFAEKVIISDGENYISCISQTEEKTNDALLILEQIEQNITVNGELDLKHLKVTIALISSWNMNISQKMTFSVYLWYLNVGHQCSNNKPLALNSFPILLLLLPEYLQHQGSLYH